MPARWTALAFFVLLAPATLLRAQTAAEKQKFFFKDGDTIVMMGDSITEQHLYSNYIEMWTVSRFPAWQLTFRNVGIGGDRSVGGNARFARDVLAHKPTALTVDFGMNDGGYQSFNPKLFDAYMKGLQGIADQAKKAGIRVAWITPQPVEHGPDDKREFYNDTLEKFSAGVKEIASKNDGLFVDQFHPYWAVVEKARAAGMKGRITGGDAVHPGPPGQAVMAASILKGMGFPREVSSVTLVAEEENATSIMFKHEAKALPFFPDEARSILKWTPLLEEMNHYGLRVHGLKKGRYQIRMNGKKVAERSSDELAKGVNLADEVLKAGPIADQVKAVWTAVKEKNKYFHDQIFRGVVLASPKAPVFKDVPAGEIEKRRQEIYQERMKKMPELDAAVRRALVMRSYQVEIVPATK
jgi:lysophospholipase L1-like esterase